MYYISNIRNRDNKVGVTDTNDGVEEFYSKSDFISFAKKVRIDGVLNDEVFVVEPKNITVKKINARHFLSALATMSTKCKFLIKSGTEFGVHFSIIIQRLSATRYACSIYDKDYKKSGVTPYKESDSLSSEDIYNWILFHTEYKPIVTCRAIRK